MVTSGERSPKNAILVVTSLLNGSIKILKKSLKVLLIFYFKKFENVLLFKGFAECTSP